MTAPTGTGVRAELLDCLQANLALLADRFHGAGRHLALGARLRFDTVPGADGLPTVEPTPERTVDDARDLLGLGAAAEWTVPPGGSPERVLAGHDLVYVVADAFHLPWVPYHTHRHMEHSFLLEHSADGLVALDAYHNDTPWGPARPGRWELTADQLRTALAEGARVVRFEPVDVPQPVPRIVPPSTATVEAYLRAYREHPDRPVALGRLTLETWLLARSRRLHAALRAAVPPSAGELTGAIVDRPGSGGPIGRRPVEEHVRRWGLLAEQTYLAHRRVSRGRPEPDGVLPRLGQLLTADLTVFDGGQALVTSVVAEVLGLAEADLPAGVALPSFPAFSSFRVVDIVERLESRLGVELDPDDLVPENLHRIGDICRLVSRSLGGPFPRESR